MGISTRSKTYQCKTCGKHVANLPRHMRIHSGHESFKCDVCEEVLFVKGHLKVHMRKHTEEKSFKCDVCGKAFSRKSNLRQHMCTHTGHKPFKCHECDKTFSQKVNLKIHMHTHTGERPCKCDVCGKAFSRKSNLRQHMCTHTGYKPFKCHECDKTFSQKVNLKIHMRKHTGERPFKCNVCDKAFCRKAHFERHMNTHTGERPFKCNVCDNAFYQNVHLKAHMNTHTGGGAFKCDVCDKDFPLKGHFIRHMRTHTGEMPFKCDACDRGFSAKSNLQVHMRTHTGERPFKCDVCGKGFSQKDTRRRHMRTHTRERLFDVCDKDFSETGKPKRYMHSHSEERPFKGNVCDKTNEIKYQCKKSHQQSNFPIHIRTHYVENQFQYQIYHNFPMEQQMPYQGEIHSEEKLNQFKQLSAEIQTSRLIHTEPYSSQHGKTNQNVAKYSNLPTQLNSLDESTIAYRFQLMNDQPMISPVVINVQTEGDKKVPTWENRQDINLFSSYSQTDKRQNIPLSVPNVESTILDLSEHPYQRVGFSTNNTERNPPLISTHEEEREIILDKSDQTPLRFETPCENFSLNSHNSMHENELFDILQDVLPQINTRSTLANTCVNSQTENVCLTQNSYYENLIDLDTGAPTQYEENFSTAYRRSGTNIPMEDITLKAIQCNEEATNYLQYADIFPEYNGDISTDKDEIMQIVSNIDETFTIPCYANE